MTPLDITSGDHTNKLCSAKILQQVKTHVKNLILLILSILLLTHCQSPNEKVRIKVKALVVSVTPKAILEAIAELDKKAPEQEGTLMPLEILPPTLSAFSPVEVRYYYKGSYLIVTDRWVQHRTGLFVAAPDEKVPESSKHLTYEKLGDRLYFYQD